MYRPVHILDVRYSVMAHVNKKAAEKVKEQKIYGHMIKKTIRGIFVDVKSETPSIAAADVQSDVALRRAMKCGRLQRSVKNIGGRPFSFIYDANFMRSKLLRFSAFDVRDNVLESEYILGNLFICAEDMESNLNDDDFQFIVKQSVAARWGAAGASMPIVLIGDKEFESTDENAAQLEKINELLDIVSEMAKDD